MCGHIGPWELLIVFAIVLLLVGAQRLPKLGKALGETVKAFKKGTNIGGAESDETSEKPSTSEDPPKQS